MMEVQSYVHQILFQRLLAPLSSTDRKETVIGDLLNGLRTKNPRAWGSEQVLQGVLGEWLRRVDRTFGQEYQDIFGPIRYYLGCLRHGIRQMVLGGKLPPQDQQATHLLETVRIGQYPRIEKEFNEDLEVAFLEHMSSVSSLSLTNPADEDWCNRLHNLIGRIMKAWSDAEEKRKKDEIDAADIYKRKKEEAHQGELLPEEEDDQERLALFPQYDQVWEGVDQELDQRVLTGGAIPTTETNGIKEEAQGDQDTLDQLTRRIGRVGRLYTRVMRGPDRSARVSPSSSSGVIDARLTYLQHQLPTTSSRSSKEEEEDLIAQTEGDDMSLLASQTPLGLDEAARDLLQFSMLYTKNGQAILGSVGDCTDTITSPLPPHDFYHDPQPKEASRLYAILSALGRRIKEDLLSQWPEHAILQYLMALVDRISGFHLSSTLSSLLTGIELLLRKAEDWEAYSDKAHSLRHPHLDALTALVVDWRRAELSSWPGLLRVEEEKLKQGVYERWWPHLYGTVMSLVADDEKEEEVIGMVEEFLRSGTLGDYEERVRMVEGIYEELRVKVQYDQGRRCLSSLGHILQFHGWMLGSSRVRKEVEARGAKMRRDLSVTVKMASWKDTNVHALRESAIRSHRTLAKSVRKYREEVLLTKVYDILGDSRLDEAVTWNGIIPRDPTLPPLRAQEVRGGKDEDEGIIKPVETGLTRWRKWADDVMEQDVALHEQTLMEGAAPGRITEEILQTLKTLQEGDTFTYPPSEEKSKEEEATRRERHFKNRRQVKRKVLVDTIKWLRALGVRSRRIPGERASKGFIWRRLIGASNLMDMERILPSTEARSMLYQIEAYWTRIMKGLPAAIEASILLAPSPASAADVGQMERVRVAGLIQSLVDRVSLERDQVVGMLKGTYQVTWERELMLHVLRTDGASKLSSCWDVTQWVGNWMDRVRGLVMANEEAKGLLGPSQVNEGWVRAVEDAWKAVQEKWDQSGMSWSKAGQQEGAYWLGDRIDEWRRKELGKLQALEHLCPRTILGVWERVKEEEAKFWSKAPSFSDHECMNDVPTLKESVECLVDRLKRICQIWKRQEEGKEMNGGWGRMNERMDWWSKSMYLNEVIQGSREVNQILLTSR